MINIPNFYNEEKYNLLVSYEGKTGLTAALAECVRLPWNRDAHVRLHTELANLYGKPIDQIDASQFANRELQKAVASLAGEDMAQKLTALVFLRLEGQFSSSVFRKSYRSKHFMYYAYEIVSFLCNLVRTSCLKTDLRGILLGGKEKADGLAFWMESTQKACFEYLLALELRNGNKEYRDLVQEALTGDNSRVFLSRTVIEAIILSGDPKLLDMLERLLLAAKLQEGLRQQILESADKGGVRVLTRFLSLCTEHDLFRFASVCRAFFVWTGMGAQEEKPQTVRLWAIYARDCLTDEALRKAYLASEDNTKAYFALWATGCFEMHDADNAAQTLLRDEKHYRRVLGWYFISHSDNSTFQRTIACRQLNETDPELLAWVVHNLCGYSVSVGHPYGATPQKRTPIVNDNLPAKSAERAALFDMLEKVALRIGNKKQTFSGNPFSFATVELTAEPVHRLLMALAAYDMNNDLIGRLLALAPQMCSELRNVLLRYYLLPDKIPSHRAFLLQSLDDRSIANKETAVNMLATCKLGAQDLQLLAETLRTKSGTVKKSVMSVLAVQDSKLLSPLIAQMLADSAEHQNQAAIELLQSLSDKHPKLIDAHADALAALRTRPLSAQTQILLDKLTPDQKKTEVFTPENGFGLYDPKTAEDCCRSFAVPSEQKRGLLDKLFGKKTGDGLYSEKELRSLLPTEREIQTLFEKLDGVFAKHADFEYETAHADGSRAKVLFGDAHYFALPLPSDCLCLNLQDERAVWDMIPFAAEFADALGDYATDVSKAVALRYVTLTEYGFSAAFGDRFDVAPWYERLKAKDLAVSYAARLHQKFRRCNTLLDLLHVLHTRFDTHTFFAEVHKWHASMLELIGDNLSEHFLSLKPNAGIVFGGSSSFAWKGIDVPMLARLRGMLEKLHLSDEDFSLWFATVLRCEQIAGVVGKHSVSLGDCFRACEMGLIPRDVLTERILRDKENPGAIFALTRRNAPFYKQLTADYPWAAEYIDTIVSRIVCVEQTRGELPTPLTDCARGIQYFEGASHFCALLAALGKEDFFRGYAYGATSKKESLSLLLGRCYPSPDDTAETLGALVKAASIPEKRLAQAALYAPQWARFAETVLGWDGLHSAVWFFHAHINEQFSAEKETEVARYSPITPLQFNDGAFDRAWFFDAYRRLGDKQFDTLFKYAKYITAGSNAHRRSQIYVEAALGKADKAVLEGEIMEKRNPDKLRSYPLLPIEQSDLTEALHRYEFIQAFQKQSKQFGAQKRETEKKACMTALENLAFSMGYTDVNRLTWQMESQKLKKILPLTEPIALDGFTARLFIDENGKASVVIEKDGKALKTVPKALAKNETYLSLKEAAKELSELSRRAVQSFENAMIDGDRFTAAELTGILQNPVLSPVAGKLVWMSDGTFGMPVLDGTLMLCKADGSRVPVGEHLRLAHPHDLRTAGIWADWMRALYDQKCIQPFKQIFREYYPLTEDELQEKTVSRRYAGHQLQPKRTVALLRTRGWTVDYETGLQKVCHKQNIIARMFALADWFTPADIEAPTLETVEFFDRTNSKNIPLTEIPPILFSEVMRDLDLAVSVAHVGGVDPEASHSTVEMRTSIAKELTSLLGLQNVTWIGSHAKIHGTLSNYSVHMGSGVVHAEGIGMLAILPVHSSARGRIFLPFADDDPKTAEILSKIILLAEDQKLKDPTILSQLR